MALLPPLRKAVGDAHTGTLPPHLRAWLVSWVKVQTVGRQEELYGLLLLKVNLGWQYRSLHTWTLSWHLRPHPIVLLLQLTLKLTRRPAQWLSFVFKVALKLNAVLSHLGASQMEWGQKYWSTCVSLKINSTPSDLPPPHVIWNWSWISESMILFPWFEATDLRCSPSSFPHSSENAIFAKCCFHLAIPVGTCCQMEHGCALEMITLD